jgi:hypothetical protein
MKKKMFWPKHRKKAGTRLLLKSCNFCSRSDIDFAKHINQFKSGNTHQNKSENEQNQNYKQFGLKNRSRFYGYDGRNTKKRSRPQLQTFGDGDKEHQF